MICWKIINNCPAPYGAGNTTAARQREDFMSLAKEFKKMLREEEPETSERAEAARRHEARRKNHEWAEGPIRRIDLYRAAVLIGVLAGGAYAELAETESPEFGARIDLAILTMESIVNKFLPESGRYSET
jgi:hypothetical protein